MPNKAFEGYFECLQPPNLRAGRLLDVGAGPGLQTEMLLSRIPRGWTVTALEPSMELRTSALTRLKKFGSRVSLLGDRFERFVAGKAFDAVWLSEVVHLLGDVNQWVCQLSKIMNLNGRVLVRTSTHTQLRKREWYQFFPSALKIDLDRHPTKSSVLNGLAGAGFSEISEATIDESRWISTHVLLAMMKAKAFSTLHYLDQQELDKGLRSMTEALRQIGPRTRWHYEMTSYTATFIGG